MLILNRLHEAISAVCPLDDVRGTSAEDAGSDPATEATEQACSGSMSNPFGGYTALAVDSFIKYNNSFNNLVPNSTCSFGAMEVGIGFHYANAAELGATGMTFHYATINGGVMC